MGSVVRSLSQTAREAMMHRCIQMYTSCYGCCAKHGSGSWTGHQITTSGDHRYRREPTCSGSSSTLWSSSPSTEVPRLVNPSPTHRHRVAPPADRRPPEPPAAGDPPRTVQLMARGSHSYEPYPNQGDYETRRPGPLPQTQRTAGKTLLHYLGPFLLLQCRAKRTGYSRVGSG